MMRRVILGCGAIVSVMAAVATAQARWTVDPWWPRPLPNHWILGSVTGLAVDASDRTWIAHRGAASMVLRTENGLDASPKGSEYCCAAAPAILAFDASGQLVSRWGGPGTGYDWPLNPGGIAVDGRGHVWLAAQGLPPAPAGRGARGGGAAPAPPPEDAHVLKFTTDGKFVLQIGKAGAPGDPASRTGLRRPADLDVDAAAGEVFVADTGNRRVVVFDANTGAYKRHWGAYGGAPDASATLPPYSAGETSPRQFRSVSCVTLASGGEVFVCDRESNRFQVFRRDGTYVREAIVSGPTLGAGSVWDIALSRGQGQAMVLVANGTEQTVHVLNRQTLTETARIGTGGRWPGHFYGVGSIGMDSRGNVITGEALEGKRIQKFVAR